ncbi:hypothetical protein G4B88_016514 [Cannabis sativa]|uniref:Uncharacterized protein n=1 Tax=Cannabis sativa TaxID=3483 RepID=A0A7J6H7H5_CANSA|nr:hypothetical protein G4B88_016514 [Cannabis sativa]
MARSNSTSSDFDKDNFRKPIAIPFKWESQPGIPKIPSTPPFSKYDYLDDDNDDDRNIKEENGLTIICFCLEELRIDFEGTRVA